MLTATTQPGPRSVRARPAPSTSAPRRTRPRAPSAASAHAHHWIGPLYCQTETCGRILGEIFADSAGLTYLANVGGDGLYTVGVRCPGCGATRTFQSQPGGPLAGLENKGYDQT